MSEASPNADLVGRLAKRVHETRMALDEAKEAFDQANLDHYAAVMDWINAQGPLAPIARSATDE